MRGTRTVLGAVIVSVVLALAPTGQAYAAPPTPDFGPTIDAYSPLDQQKTCEHSTKPGPAYVKDLLNATYGNHTWGIGRPCNGTVSEHHEGRALDYHFNANDPADKARAEDFLGWLLATDQYGNTHANARRLGVMYLIWNHRIWDSHIPHLGWQPYTEPNPHTDHIHISFSWPGALKQTSWYTHQAIGRIGVLKNGELIVKEGATNAGWGATQMPGVAKFEIDGSRIGVLTTTGQLWVKEGALNAGWGDKQADGVKDFHLAGTRIGILRNDTTLAVKEGPTNAPWTEQTNQVTDFDLTQDRIGVVYTNGIASVKAGNLNEGWANQLGNAKDIELGGNRIGIRRVDNSLVVKEGTIYDPNWVEETPDVVDFDLTATRIGVVLSNGLATVKEGGLSTGWHDQRGDAKDIELSGNRIGVLLTDTRFTVKEGGLNAFWDDQTAGVTQGDLAHR